MKNKFLTIRIYSIVLLLFFTSLLFYGILVPIEGWDQIILLFLVLLMMPTTLFLGFIKALTTSLLLLIGIGLYMTYEVMLNLSAVDPEKIFLLVALPVGAFIVGNIEKTLREALDECQNCSNIAEKMIFNDEVTGFGNGKGFLKDLEMEIAKAKRYQQPLTLGVLEIQYYKDLVRLYENNVDKVFEKMAEAINCVIRLEDMKYRIDKDQIGIILPFTNLKQSKIVRERLKEAIKELEIQEEKEGNKKFSITTKLGLLEYHRGITNHVEFKNLAEKELEYDV